jgi:hypothetical protein
MNTDQSLRDEIIRVMKEHPKLDTTHLDVVVHDGIVTLKGQADTEEEKNLAATLARSVPGVTELKNELHIGTGIIYTITNLVSGLAASNDHDLHKDKPQEKKDD